MGHWNRQHDLFWWWKIFHTGKGGVFWWLSSNAILCTIRALDLARADDSSGHSCMFCTWERTAPTRFRRASMSNTSQEYCKQILSSEAATELDNNTNKSNEATYIQSLIAVGWGHAFTASLLSWSVACMTCISFLFETLFWQTGIPQPWQHKTSTIDPRKSPLPLVHHLRAIFNGRPAAS